VIWSKCVIPCKLLLILRIIYWLVTGEAEYINDISPKFGELFGAFVLSTEAVADLVEIDASAAEVTYRGFAIWI